MCLVILAIECHLTAYLVVVPKRVTYFSKEFMAQFKEEHQKAFGPESDVPNGGFPDTGNGYYSDKLPYDKWYYYNCANRTHMNFVETLPQIIGLSLFCGLCYPSPTMYILISNVLARPVYAYLYVTGGTNNRYLGVFAGILPLYILSLVVIATKTPNYFADIMSDFV